MLVSTRLARQASAMLGVALAAALVAPAAGVSVRGQEASSLWSTLKSFGPTGSSDESEAARNGDIVANAGFDEDGYLTIVKLESSALTEEYVRRLAESMNLEIIDKGGLSGLIPHYSGEKASQTLFSLRMELLAAAAQPNSWVTEAAPQSSLLRVRVSGMTAPLSESGYRGVSRLQDDNQMGAFVRRTAASLGLYVSDEARLNGLVPFYSGKKSTQSFASLRAELFGEVRATYPFVTSGSLAALSEAGWSAVKALNNKTEMATYISRVSRHVGCYVVNDEGLGAMTAVLLSGRAWTYVALENAVRKECGIDKRESWFGKVHDVVGQKGVWQIRMDGTDRYKYSEMELKAAGVVPIPFSATDKDKADPKELSDACPLYGARGTERTCFAQAKHINEPGCRTKIEQAITHSHMRAWMEAKKRTDSDWTLIMEDDVIPLHPGFFDEAFQRAWEKVPPETKIVRLGWCSFEHDLGPVRRETYADAGEFRLIRRMSWLDGAGNSHYYTGGCTTSYVVHRSILDQMLSIFPCCCPIDCCLERQLFYQRAQPWYLNLYSGKMRGEQVMMSMDAWDSKEDAFNYTSFVQGGVLVQDNREHRSLRPQWQMKEKNETETAKPVSFTWLR